MRYRLRTLLIVLAVGPPTPWGALWLWQWAIAPRPGEDEIIVEEWLIDGNGTKTRFPLARKP
jgi:hypothetical protein